MTLRPVLILVLGVLLSACGAAAQQIVPTDRPTTTPTFTPTVTRTPGFGATPSPTPRSAASGPTPTSIFGATQTPLPADVTVTRVVNPNAPRIEFFTTNVLQVAPGDQITLFWSVRGTRGATIYRLDANGVRGNLWNVPPDGNLTVNTSRRERGQVSFLLVAGEGELETTQTLTVPLLCPDPWFFQPAPDSCPTGPAEPSLIVEQPFDRGRMVYIQSRNRVYALFNDGSDPHWLSFENRYDPAIHPELDESFEQSKPPGSFQPLRALGFVWRGNDVVRNRLGLGTNVEIGYDGFVQTVTSGDNDTLYVNSADGTVLQLLPEGEVWQLITPPSS